VPKIWWLIGAAFALMVWWVLFVATPTVVALIGGGLAAAIVAITLVRYGAVRVVVDETGLHAGKAHLPRAWVGNVESLDAEQTRRVLGVDADARAFLVVRPYCDQSVKVRVDDAADPTPYWLLSTRHRESLARCLRSTTVRD